MESKFEQYLLNAITFFVGGCLIIGGRALFEKLFPAIEFNSYWVYGYLVFVLSGLFWFRDEKRQIVLTLLFIVLPITLMFFLTWIFMDSQGPYGYIFKHNFPRSILTGFAIFFLFYVLRNPPQRIVKKIQNDKKNRNPPKE